MNDFLTDYLQSLHGIPILTHEEEWDLAARVAAKIDEWEPDAVFIDAGQGGGVIDRLRQLGYDVTEVPFGGKATMANLFLNRRAEMWWAMKEARGLKKPRP
mgnify:CR=1 FL=1